MNRLALFLCDESGIMARPWLRAGYDCMTVDLAHDPGMNREGNLYRVGADVLTWLPPRREYAFCFAFPPCTDLSVSGARWFKSKGLRSLAHAIDVFGRCLEICEWTGAAYGAENPVSVISSHYRKPDYSFHPWQFGDLYTKKTCLWTGGGFVMPEPIHRMEPAGVTAKIHLMPPSDDRARLRSLTPAGFAEAVYLANRPALTV